MKQINQNILANRQKKLLLVAPLIVIPFLTLFFWGLGGGKGQAKPNSSSKGLNTELPGARNAGDTLGNKMSFYERSEKDSMKMREAQKNDPYYRTGSPTDSLLPGKGNANAYSASPVVGYNNPAPLYGANSNLAANEAAINQRLAEINKQLSQSQPATPDDNARLDELQQKMSRMNGNNTDTDPELEQLSKMLDKIQQIQNPAIAQQKQREESIKNRGLVFAVTSGNNDNAVNLLEPNAVTQGLLVCNGFYSLSDTAGNYSQNAIQAAVAETKTLVNGSIVSFRLRNDIYVNGVLIPKDNMISGIAQLNGERLEVKINSIRYRQSTFPVSLVVVDLDGLNGIYIPGAITRDVAKESADQSIQNIGLSSYDASLGAQAASAGIEAAKTLFSRKVRLVKVTVKAGYQVLLKDEKQQQGQ